MIIWGAFNLLGSPLTLLSDIGATDLNGNEISYPIEYFVITILTSISLEQLLFSVVIRLLNTRKWEFG